PPSPPRPHSPTPPALLPHPTPLRSPELDAEAERVADGLGQSAQLGAAAGDDHAADVRVAALHAEELEGAPDLGGQLHQHRPQGRSEEHTSELQSRENLVCRLLLEKK